MTERFDLELQAFVGGEWHTIMSASSCGSQDTGKLRSVADDSVVPMKVIELHE